jgi:hypothetical protein
MRYLLHYEMFSQNPERRIFSTLWSSPTVCHSPNTCSFVHVKGLWCTPGVTNHMVLCYGCCAVHDWYIWSRAGQDVLTCRPSCIYVIISAFPVAGIPLSDPVSGCPSSQPLSYLPPESFSIVSITNVLLHICIYAASPP